MKTSQIYVKKPIQAKHFYSTFVQINYFYNKTINDSTSNLLQSRNFRPGRYIG